MHLISSELEKYIEQHTSEETPLLNKIHRETYLNVLMPQMLSGRVQGEALKMFSRMIRPRRVLELGTFTGYSALCLAEGLTDDGKLISIDINIELLDRVQAYVDKAGLQDKVELWCGKASDIIPKLDDLFDLVFIDADKINYSLYLDLVIDKVRPGGLIIADNVLWSGKVLDVQPDKDTKAIIDFNHKVNQDKRLHKVIIPVRDGMMIMFKKG
ncbi:MAG: O-methyltransferase [Bacteroidota bacterium]